MRVYHESTRFGKRESKPCVCRNHLPSSRSADSDPLAKSKSCPTPFILLLPRLSVNAMASSASPPLACTMGRQYYCHPNVATKGYTYAWSMTRSSSKSSSRWNTDCVSQKLPITSKAASNSQSKKCSVFPSPRSTSTSRALATAATNKHKIVESCHPERSEGSLYVTIDPSLLSGSQFRQGDNPEGVYAGTDITQRKNTTSPPTHQRLRWPGPQEGPACRSRVAGRAP